MRARDNPFATDRVLRIRYELPDGDWPGLLARLDRLDYRAAIVGPHGTGKTTLLEDVQERLHAAGVPVVSLRLDAEHQNFARGTLEECFATVTQEHVICLDGAEQLTPFAWSSFKRRTLVARGLLITSHRTGMLPTLITCTTNPDLFEQIVARLLPASPPDGTSPASPLTLPTPDTPPTPPTPRDLFLKHDGNLRDALREMYDWYAALPHGCAG
jgi:hypothetical protein